jgi:hypothetical protein
LKNQNPHNHEVISEKVNNIIYIWEPMLRANFWIILCKSHKAFEKILKRQFPKLKIEDKVGTSGGFLQILPKDNQKDIGCLNVIWANPEMHYIAHEVFHAVTEVMDTRGMKIEPDHDEPGAYLCGFLMGEIMRYSTKQKRPRRA